MKDVITYVGIDAHKNDVHVAMLVVSAEQPTRGRRCSGVCRTADGGGAAHAQARARDGRLEFPGFSGH
jgi:hypothetical protein